MLTGFFIKIYKMLCYSYFLITVMETWIEGHTTLLLGNAEWYGQVNQSESDRDKLNRTKCLANHDGKTNVIF